MAESLVDKGMRGVSELVDQRTVTIDLATARDKEFIKEFRECDYIEIDSITSGGSAQIRFNSPRNPDYEANKYRRFKASKEIPFKKLYITNTAQVAKVLVLKCGGDKSVVAERESSIAEIVNPVGVAIITLDDFSYNQTTVGVAEVQLVVASTPAKKGVLVKAISTNSGIVYAGKTGVLTTTGFELTPKEGVLIEVDDANKIYLIGSAADQKVCWIAI